MPSNIFTNPFGGGGRGEGGVLGLGPAQNTFGDSSTADRTAAETLRDTYATNNAAWLAQYNDDLGLWIRLVWNGGVAEQRRNSAGTDWEDVTNVIRGQAGTAGVDGTDGMPGAPGGGAWNSLGSHTQTADHASNVFVATGITVPANREILGYRVAGTADDLEDNLGIAVLDGTHIFASTASAAGATSTDATRVRLPEFGGGGFLAGSIHAGHTAAREILISTSNANQNFAIEFYELVPETTIVDVTGKGPPDASADTLTKIFIDAEIPRLWFTHVVPVYTNDPTGTFNEFVDNDPMGGVYLGDTTSVPGGTHNDGDYYYRHGSTHGWYQQESGRFRQRSSSTVLGANTTWLGDAQDADTALRRIDSFDMNRRYMFFNVGADRVEILDNSTFTAQTATLTYEYGTLEGRASIAAWAERTNTQLIPFDKMPFVWQNNAVDLANVQTINFGNNLGAVVDANGVLTITGQAGMGGGLTQAQVQALIAGTDISTLQGQLAASQIPTEVFTDAEFTAAAVRTLLGLTEDETNQLLTGTPTITGDTITFTRNDGMTVTLSLADFLSETEFDDQRGNRIYLSSPTTFDTTTATLTLSLRPDIRPSVGDQVLFIVPGGIGNADDAITVSGATATPDYPLANDDGDPIGANHLFAGRVYTLFLGSAQWRILQPLDERPITETTLAVGWSTDQTVEVAELTATAMGHSVVVPVHTTNDYIVLWHADSQGTLSAVYFGTAITNSITTFEAATDLEFMGVAGKARATTNRRVAALVSGETIRVEFS